jgi:hypothetical protein
MKHYILIISVLRHTSLISIQKYTIMYKESTISMCVQKHLCEMTQRIRGKVRGEVREGKVRGREGERERQEGK